MGTSIVLLFARLCHVVWTGLIGLWFGPDSGLPHICGFVRIFIFGVYPGCRSRMCFDILAFWDGIWCWGDYTKFILACVGFGAVVGLSR